MESMTSGGQKGTVPHSIIRKLSFESFVRKIMRTIHQISTRVEFELDTTGKKEREKSPVCALVFASILFDICYKILFSLVVVVCCLCHHCVTHSVTVSFLRCYDSIKYDIYSNVIKKDDKT